ncbi:cyd operon protein YbgT [Pseudochrobactrum saccharolyticum]|uniref:Cyd operon protein YbgT n=1 Tax=Pseudochrobactrum saccharolyticum TaxID=354352 RepID=A0A7W8ALM6_9HYPH|nr:cytochrome bd-I oxidase subunit CydX [Pseudochrobactrum saccharolyticum]MBB5092629.1 cyd operon protein YbgT [Pseudochrobactrum saccharolyticum]
MWYFSWILGLGLASSFAIFNAMWFELRNDVLVRAPAITPEMKKMPVTPEMKLNEQAAVAGKGQKV